MTPYCTMYIVHHLSWVQNDKRIICLLSLQKYVLRNKFSSSNLKRFVLFYQNHNVSKFCRFVVLTRNKAKQLIENHGMFIDPTNTIFAVVYKLEDCSWF